MEEYSMRSSMLVLGVCFLIGMVSPFVDTNAQETEDIRKRDFRLELIKVPPNKLLELYETTPQPAQRDIIAETIIIKREDTIPHLRNILRIGTERQKLLSLGLLMEMRDKASSEILIPLLEDKSLKVQRRTAFALGYFKYGGAYPMLVAMLKPSQDPGVAKSVLAGLGMLGDKKATQVIQRWLNHSNLSVGVNAAISLAALGNESGIDKAIEASKSEDNQTRREGTYGLGFFRNPKARLRLQEILADPEAPWKTEAEIALSKINLSNTPLNNRQNLLKGLVEHPNRGVAKWAIDEISEIKTPQAKEILESVSADKTKKGDYARRKLLILQSLP
jgi:HEAT repeat protein